MKKQSLLIIITFFLLLFFTISCSNSEASKDKTDVAPGSASILGKISSIDNSDNGSLYEIVISKVNQLGRGAPLLNKGDKINVRVPDSFNDKIASENIEVGKELNMVIKSYEAVGSLRYWQLLNLN